APGPSSLHSNVAPESAEENVNDGVLSVVGPPGPVRIVVSGGPVSTVKDRLAGEGSRLPAPSLARTESVYEPSGRGPYDFGELQAMYEPVVAPGPSSLHSNVATASTEEKVNDGVL